MGSVSRVPKTRINLYLPNDFIKQLDNEADRLGMGRSNVVCLCIENYFRMKSQENAVSVGAEAVRELGLDKALEFIGINK